MAGFSILLLVLGCLVLPSEQQVSTLFTEGSTKYQVSLVATLERRVEETTALIQNLGGRVIIVVEDEGAAHSYATKIRTRASVGIVLDKDKIVNSSSRRMQVLVLSPSSLLRGVQRKVLHLDQVSLLVVDDVEPLLAHEAELSRVHFAHVVVFIKEGLRREQLSRLQRTFDPTEDQRGGNHIASATSAEMTGEEEKREKPPQASLFMLVPVRPQSLLGHQATHHSDAVSNLELSSDLWRTLSQPMAFVRQSLGDYKFKNAHLLAKAFLHPAYKAKQRKGNTESFEPLDYVGNFVLDYMVSKYILQNAANKTQGYMASKKAAIMKQESLAFFAAKQNFNTYVLVDGENERKSLNDYVRSVQGLQTLSDLNAQPRKRSFLYKFFKSVAGALYVDAGYDLRAVENIYLKFIKKDMDALLAGR